MPRGYKDVSMCLGEQIVEQYPATVGQASGLLVVTNQRILFQPVDWRMLNKIVHLGLRMIGGHTAIIGHFVNAYVRYSNGTAASVPAEEIISLGTEGSANKIYIATADGNNFEFSVTASLFTLRGATANRQARDAILRAVASYGGYV